MYQNPFLAGGCDPNPPGGAYDPPPDILVGWGGGNPLHSPGISISPPSVPPFYPPPSSFQLIPTLITRNHGPYHINEGKCFNQPRQRTGN